MYIVKHIHSKYLKYVIHFFYNTLYMQQEMYVINSIIILNVINFSLVPNKKNISTFTN